MGRAKYLYKEKRFRYSCRWVGCPFKCYVTGQMRRHVFLRHECGRCGIEVFNLALHICDVGDMHGGQAENFAVDADISPFELYESAHHSRLQTFRCVQLNNVNNLPDLFCNMEEPVRRLLTHLLDRMKGLKVEFVSAVKLHNPVTDIYKQTYFSSPMYTLLHPNFIANIYNLTLIHQLSILELFTVDSSGWILIEILSFDVNVGLYRPITGRGYLPTPVCFRNRRGLLNIKTNTWWQNHCFAFCIAAKFYPYQGSRVAETNCKHYERYVLSNFNWDSVLPFPVRINDLSKFEDDNNLSINIYHHEDKLVYPILITKKVIARDRHVDMLLIQQGDNFHFVLIQNMSAFLQNRHAKYDLCRYCLGKFPSTDLMNHSETCLAPEGTVGPLTLINNLFGHCLKCLNPFRIESLLIAHEAQCRSFQGPILKFPDERALTFKNYTATLPIPWLVFADFETFLVPVNRQKMKSRTVEAGTFVKNQHVPAAYAYALVDDNGIRDFKLYEGADCVQNFIESLLALADQYIDMVKQNEEMQMSERDEILHEMQTFCFLCKKTFNVPGTPGYNRWLPTVIKNRHHSHIDHFENGRYYLASEYVSALCSVCNLSIKFKHKLYVFLHNNLKFDGKLILAGLSSSFLHEKKVHVIAKTMENMLSIDIGDTLRISDSLQHLRSSLDGMVTMLRQEGTHAFKYTNTFFKIFDNPLFNYETLYKKMAFPYSYMTGPLVLNETCLPTQDKFYNDLKEEPCSDEEYARAQEIWNMTGCTSFRDFMHVYLALDTMLLCDVFMTYRKKMMSLFNLDLAYFLTGNSYSFQIFLYKSKACIDYLKSPELILFAKRHCRGGICNSVARYKSANYPDLPEFDNSKPQSALFFADVISMYPSKMAQPLPLANFRFLDDTEILNFDITTMCNTPGVGFVLDVDLDYDNSLFLASQFFPYLPDKIKINYEYFSDYQKSLFANLNMKNVDAAERLLLTLFPKSGYVVYHQLLAFYISRGINVIKINQILQFTERPFVSDHITQLLNMRANSNYEVERYALKILMNSLFGFFLLNQSKYREVKVCLNADDATKYLSKPNYERHFIVNEDLSIFQMKPTSVLFTSPLFMGSIILDLSKLELYSFYYLVLTPHFQNRILPVLMDTDSFLIYCELAEGESLVEKLKQLQFYFDFSNIHENSALAALKSNENKNKAGKYRLEFEGFRIKEVVSVRLKTYCLRLEDAYNVSEIRKARGITKTALRNITFENYKRCVFNDEVTRCRMTHIRSEKLLLHTIITESRCMHSFTAHRIILSDKIHTLPFGFNVEDYTEQELIALCQLWR